jgi:putative ABC transport system permease protein
MLQLKSIVKTYTTENLTQDALKDVSIGFRENEFVSILGPSGSGKTTLLNIIGGLDRYTSGDLIINGVSTKKYADADWDYYRNNSIGFVFQSYNLIPHQTVLANVELSLTLAGVSASERRERAAAVLKKVGLEDQMHKRPNQLSGGQMQRVAIARALINNPDILLADEPTGALDSETSVQILELLKEIAKDKLVVMVTHNAELAKRYSTRIVNLLDGKVISDSNPCADNEATAAPQKKKKVSMSFLTALSLSFNNLRTKKGRTLLTGFAGSIGIIGIALILALSNGVNVYITALQKETMTAYPIVIGTQVNGDRGNKLDRITSGLAGATEETDDGNETVETDDGIVYADYRKLYAGQTQTSASTENDLASFKRYLDDLNGEIRQYIGENGIVYSYDVSFDVYSYDSEGVLVNTAAETSETTTTSEYEQQREQPFSAASFMGLSATSGAKNFSQLMPGTNGNAVSGVITESYNVLSGTWPTAYDEVVLVLNENNSLSAEVLYQLGFITNKQYTDIAEAIERGEEPSALTCDVEDMINHTFYLLPSADLYTQNARETFSPGIITTTRNELLDGALKLKIAGIVRPIADEDGATISAAVGYTSLLTDYVIERTNESAVIIAQKATPEINVLTGLAFKKDTDEGKAALAAEFLSGLNTGGKATWCKQISAYIAENPDLRLVGPDISDISDMETADENVLAEKLDKWLASSPEQSILVKLYSYVIAGSSYEANMTDFGMVSFDRPSSISIYVDSFEDKEAIGTCIENYNQSADSASQITYTDFAAQMASSVTSMVSSLSLVLIVFVSISLIVSCIMISVITHISVMERTKEIGILRALGASKSNISQVFNAETFIIGCLAGVLGVVISLLAIIPINAIIESLSGISGISAQLPALSAVILIAVSIAVTLLGGLLPAKKAAKRDPVVALRTE